MKRRILMFFMVALSILILGCAQQAEQPIGPFVGGDDGLEIGYVGGEPPSSIFDDNQEDFDITVNVENVGEFDIPPNKVIGTLSGIDATSFSISNPNVVLKSGLEGVSKSSDDVFKGDEDELRFENAKYKYDLVADFTTSVRMDICYLYQTRATTKVCLKKEATDRDTDDACQVNNENIQVFNSGAPVQVNSVLERSSGTNKVQLSFTVENKGSGTVYPPKQFSNTCVREQDKEHRLDVEVRTGSGRHDVSCSQLDGKASGEIKLTENKKHIRCDITTSSAPAGAVEEPVNIVIDYFYKNAITTPLDVEDSES